MVRRGSHHKWKSTSGPLTVNMVRLRHARRGTGGYCSPRRVDFDVSTLSLRMYVGTPRVRNSHSSVSITSAPGSERATWMAKHSRVYSSTIVSMRIFLPRSVWSSTKSYDHTWFGHSALWITSPFGPRRTCEESEKAEAGLVLRPPSGLRLDSR